MPPQGAYRVRATMTGGGANVLSLSPPFLSRSAGEEGGWGEGEGRQACSAALTTIVRTIGEPDQKPRFFDML